MAVTASVCTSYLREILTGLHLDTDTYKCALYVQDDATLSSATTAYTATGEVVGTGYTAGGVALTGFSAAVDSGVACLDFNDPTWSQSTITADAALIYNASRGNAAVCVVTFAEVSSMNGSFSVQWPAATSTTALVRLRVP